MVYTVEVLGTIPENAYFYVNKENVGFLIDPGAEGTKLVDFARDKGIVVEKILITHGHFDHMGAAEETRKKLGAELFMIEAGKEYAEDAKHNLSAYAMSPFTLSDVKYLPPGSAIALDADENFSLEVIAAPGHTKDGAIYYSKNDGIAFVGDTIFRGSFGRTDLYGGNEDTLMKTIREKIFTLPENTKLYSGHSEATTVAEEMGSSFWRYMLNS